MPQRQWKEPPRPDLRGPMDDLGEPPKADHCASAAFQQFCSRLELTSWTACASLCSRGSRHCILHLVGFCRLEGLADLLGPCPIACHGAPASRCGSAPGHGGVACTEVRDEQVQVQQLPWPCSRERCWAPSGRDGQQGSRPQSSSEIFEAGLLRHCIEARLRVGGRCCSPWVRLSLRWRRRRCQLFQLLVVSRPKSVWNSLSLGLSPVRVTLRAGSCKQVQPSDHGHANWRPIP